MRWWWCLPCTRPTSLAGFFIVLVHWNSSPQKDMSLHSDTLYCFRTNDSLFLLLIVVCLAEKQQKQVLVFGLTRLGLEYTVYRIRGKHANVEFEDTKGVIRSRKLKDRQYNDLKKKDKRTNNDLQNITQKNKDRITGTPLKKPGVNSGAPPPMGWISKEVNMQYLLMADTDKAE